MIIITDSHYLQLLSACSGKSGHWSPIIRCGNIYHAYSSRGTSEQSTTGLILLRNIIHSSFAKAKLLMQVPPRHCARSRPQEWPPRPRLRLVHCRRLPFRSSCGELVRLQDVDRSGRLVRSTRIRGRSGSQLTRRCEDIMRVYMHRYCPKPSWTCQAALRDTTCSFLHSTSA